MRQDPRAVYPDNSVRSRTTSGEAEFVDQSVAGRTSPWLVHIEGNHSMNGIIYLVGLIVVVLAILSLLGLR